MKNTGQNLCHDNLLLSRHCMKKFCRDKVMNVGTLKDKVFGPNIETKSR